jgi:hypothetical protein
MTPSLAYDAISLTAPSTAFIFVARPAPWPNILVGVFTAKNIMSASDRHCCEFVVKKRFGLRSRSGSGLDEDFLTPPSRARRTTLSRPGSWMGRWADCQALILRVSRSRTFTVSFELCSARTAAVGPPCLCKLYACHSWEGVLRTNISCTDEADIANIEGCIARLVRT